MSIIETRRVEKLFQEGRETISVLRGIDFSVERGEICGLLGPMFLLAPDILAIARDLSAAVSGAGLAVGLVLWLVGYRGHRFWLVLAVTLAGGFAGLSYGPDFGLQPLVGGLPPPAAELASSV